MLGKLGRSRLLGRYGPFLLLGAWAIATHPAWFLNLQPLTWGDWNFLRPETMREWWALPQAWNRGNGLGVLDYLNLDFYPQLLALGALAQLGVPFAIAERLIYMWPAALLPLFGAFGLASRTKANRWAAVLAALTYGTNPYILIIQWQQVTIAMAYGLAPWVASAYLRALDSERPTHLLATTLLLSLCFVFDPRIGIIVAALMVGGTVARALQSRARLRRAAAEPALGRRSSEPGTAAAKGGLRNGRASGIRSRAPLRQVLGPLAVVAGLTILLAADWLIPFILSGGSAARELLANQPFGDYLNLTYAMSLQHPFWTGGFPAFFVPQPTVPLFLLFPGIAFGCLLFRRDAATVAIALLALGGAFLTKQSAPPFPEAYSWLFHQVPGFDIYREGSKFFLITALAYVPLMGLCLTDLARRARGLNRAHKIAVAFLVLGLVAAVFLSAVPASEGQLGGLFAPTAVPAEYDRVSQILLSDSTAGSFYRTFWWPAFDRFGAHTNEVPALSGYDAAQSYMHSYLENPKDFRSLLNNSETSAFLDLVSVRFVVVPYDPLNEIYPVYGPQSFFLAQVRNQSGLKPFATPGMATAIFVNGQARPYVYGSTLPIPSLWPRQPSDVLATTSNLTYHLRATGATVDLPAGVPIRTILLSESFDPNWELVCDDGYRASSQGVLGLNAFAAPPARSQTCIVEFALQPATNISAVVTGLAYASVFGALAAGLALRRLRPKDQQGRTGW